MHVYTQDGIVDAQAQEEARAEIESDTQVNVAQFWQNQRFFCAAYYGYTCHVTYNDEIKQLAKAIHKFQCARLTDNQKNDAQLSCDTSKWQAYTYLASNVDDISSKLNWYLDRIEFAHKARVEELVSIATHNTYNAEAQYEDIIQPGGNLFQASTTSDETGNNETDNDETGSDYVLIFKGGLQRYAESKMNSVVIEAHRDLRSHQEEVAIVLNSGSASTYESLYLAVQDQAEEVDRLNREIDQAYLTASNDSNFNEEEFDSSKKVYWKAEDINSKGQIIKAKYGNGTQTTWGYDQFGRINSHFTTNSAGQTLLNNTYAFDAIGNLTQRRDSIEDLTEEFTYDKLNRLVGNQMKGAAAEQARITQQDYIAYDYDELGNIIYKSDLGGASGSGSYHYGTRIDEDQAGPHAVTLIEGLGTFTYDDNGNQLTGNGRTVTYSAFNKPTSIIKGGQETTLWYGAERQLMQQREQTPNGLETTRFLGGLYEETHLHGAGYTHKHHIAVAGNVIAVVETQNNSLAVTKESYLHKNHQSSVLAISDATGKVAERRYYDAFGDIKSHIGQTAAKYTDWLSYTTITSLAFTGHRTLIAAGVIHMGGRVYDAAIGRFLSADPHIQSPLNSQSLNRYAYTWNNPLSFTDPSGYFLSSIFKALKKLFDKIKKIVQKVLKVVKKVLKTIGNAVKKIGAFVKKYARVIVAVVAVVAVAVYAPHLLIEVGRAAFAQLKLSAIAGGVQGLISTGSLTGAIKGAYQGVAGAARGILNPLSNLPSALINRILPGVGGLVGSAVKAGLTNGIISKLGGNSFSQGFRAGAVGSLAFTGALYLGNLLIQGVQSVGRAIGSLFRRPTFEPPLGHFVETGIAAENLEANVETVFDDMITGNADNSVPGDSLAGRSYPSSVVDASVSVADDSPWPHFSGDGTGIDFANVEYEESAVSAFQHQILGADPQQLNTAAGVTIFSVASAGVIGGLFAGSPRVALLCVEATACAQFLSPHAAVVNGASNLIKIPQSVRQAQGIKKLNPNF